VTISQRFLAAVNAVVPRLPELRATLDRMHFFKCSSPASVSYTRYDRAEPNITIVVGRRPFAVSICAAIDISANAQRLGRIAFQKFVVLVWRFGACAASASLAA